MVELEPLGDAHVAGSRLCRRAERLDADVLESDGHRLARVELECQDPRSRAASTRIVEDIDGRNVR